MKFIDYPIDDLELVFVELPKFQQLLEHLTTLTDKWIYCLQHANDLSVVPPPMGSVTAIQQAFAIANEANLTPDELDELEHQLIFIQDQRGAITLAAKQNRAEGRVEEKRDIVRRLLALMEEAQIAGITGLSLANTQALRQEKG